MPGRQWRVISARKGERSSKVLAQTAKLHLAKKGRDQDLAESISV